MYSCVCVCVYVCVWVCVSASLRMGLDTNSSNPDFDLSSPSLSSLSIPCPTACHFVAFYWRGFGGGFSPSEGSAPVEDQATAAQRAKVEAHNDRIVATFNSVSSLFVRMRACVCPS